MLQLKNIKKEYKTGSLNQKALDDVSLNLRSNEFVAILGPSGSGKTTLLNIIGGLDRYDDGDLIINSISTKEYKDRDWDSYRNHSVGFVFQAYNLIFHQTVLANVELALTISGVSKKERRKRALEALDKVGLKKQAHKIPNQMSGGQMQRVAIARALVNNPDILLADEPTGALDTQTSIQVMELLKEVANDRLVVMVTHNPELAYQYATRIVELKDGKIISDSDPFDDGQKDIEAKHQNMGKSSMSLLTSLQLSFNNLKTKKARTLLTAFAGSIGIIGIALILSISTGVNDYIHSIEENTLSEYPLSITSSGLDMSSMINHGPGISETKEDDSIRVINMTSTLFSTISSNDLKTLKEYFEKEVDTISEYTNAIEYSYDITPHIYSPDTTTIHQINPDKTFEAMGLGSSGMSNNMMAALYSTNVFYKLPKESSLYEKQYDIKAGRWPSKYNECVLVLSSSGNMSDLILYALDLRDYSELVDMVDQFSKNEEVDIIKDENSYQYDQILNHNFKLVNASDYYVYDETYDLYIDKSEDEKYMRQLIDEGEDLNIVGIVMPKKDAEITMLKMGIAYHDDLQAHLAIQAMESDIYHKQVANPKIDIFTGKEFGDDEVVNFDMTSLFSIDEKAMEKAITIDSDLIKSNDLKLDFSSIKIDQSLLKIDLDSLFEGMKFDFKQEDILNFTADVQTDFASYCLENSLLNPDEMDQYFNEYLATERFQMLMQSHMATIIKNALPENFEAIINAKIAMQLQAYQAELMRQISNQITKAFSDSMNNLSSNMEKAIHFNSDAFMNAIKFNMDKDELSQLFVSMLVNKSASYDSNLKLLGYADLDSPISIDIYPKDFKAKEDIINILDEYNEQMKKDDESKVITYTDYVGALMSSVTDIINVISYVLIAFVAISLVVSSIMIGVITYISVLERKKEIGILRAIGASKRNISNVFNAETFIIGTLSGVMGIGITLLLLIPINEVIHSIAGNVEVSAKLPPVGAIILILLSIILTTFGGLLPASKAAKEDPVKALRSE